MIGAAGGQNAIYWPKDSGHVDWLLRMKVLPLRWKIAVVHINNVGTIHRVYGSGHCQAPFSVQIMSFVLVPPHVAQPG